MLRTHTLLLEAYEALPDTGALLRKAKDASTEPVITAEVERLLAKLRDLREAIDLLADGIEEDGMLVGPSAYRFRCNKCSHMFSDPEPKCAAGPQCPRCALRHNAVTQLPQLNDEASR